MRKEFLSYSPPSIGEAEIAEVVDTLENGWLTTGPKTRQFEADFAESFASPAALAMNSCTAALHTALIGLGVGPGDEVITSCMTFAASVNVIEHVGARPVLVDVDPETLNLDPIQVEQAITKRTRVILPVHYAGHPVDLDAIHALAQSHALTVLEDAAHAVGAKYRDRWIGEGDNPVAYSFYATKNMTTGEGGMLTGHAEFLAQARVIALHGMSREAWSRYQKGGSWKYEVVLPGFKYNMTDIQASLGICQLRRLPGFIRRRTEIATEYQQAFEHSPALELPIARPEVAHAWHLYVLRLKDSQLCIGRDQFVEELAERNIGTSVHFIPIHLHPYYAQKYGYQPSEFPVAYNSFERMLSLPLNPGMTHDDVADVIESVLGIAAKYQRSKRAA